MGIRISAVWAGCSAQCACSSRACLQAHRCIGRCCTFKISPPRAPKQGTRYLGSFILVLHEVLRNKLEETQQNLEVRWELLFGPQELLKGPSSRGFDASPCEEQEQTLEAKKKAVATAKDTDFMNFMNC
ncbi:unnamed protein product [Symbiodinium natans]|uniref:Uncharacterized protein n=1 Tax=Symbiodinium natans TaxID=878477 RepID=A0A812HI96_9DINO|nr:unnamed protein product [Symbiodinium natans]